MSFFKIEGSTKIIWPKQPMHIQKIKKSATAIYKAYKYDFLFLYSFPLIIGVTAYFTNTPIKLSHALIKTLPVVIVLIAPAVFLGKLKKIWYLLFYVISTPAFIITMMCMLMLHTFPTIDTFIPIIETNVDEAFSFVINYFDFTNYLITFFAATLPILFYRRIGLKKCSNLEHAAVFIIVMCIYCTAPKNQRLKSKFHYITNLSNCYKNYNIENLKLNKTIINSNLPISSNFSGQQLLVIAIGESLSKHHMGVYGYPRKTTPHISKDLSKQKALLFTDVISGHAYTIASVKKALTFESHENENLSGNIIDILNKAGFTTYWISSQPALNKWSTPVTKIARYANHQWFSTINKIEYINKSNIDYDEILAEKLKDVLKENNAKKAVFVHLTGSHYTYKNRYPDVFDKYKNTPPELSEVYKSASNFKKNTIYNKTNHYDNSVIYNDFVINKMLKLTKNQNIKDSIFLYFSDHGEDVYRKSEFSGHAESSATKYMFEIPFIIWPSQAAKKRKEMLKNKHILNRPYQTDNLIHTLLDMADVSHPYFDSTKSIISDSFITGNRIMAGKSYDH